MPFVRIKPNPALVKRLGVPNVPILIEGTARNALPKANGEVQVDELVDAWAQALAAHPEERVAAGPAIAQWAYAVAVEKGQAGFVEAAEHYIRLGLQFSPQNLSLRSRLALALMESGKFADAYLEYQAVMEDPRTTFAPGLWLMAARTAAALKRYKDAVKILEDIAKRLPGDDAFWDLLAEYRARAGLRPARKPAATGGWQLVETGKKPPSSGKWEVIE